MRSAKKAPAWPYKTDGDLRAAGFTFASSSRCRGEACRAEIEWWQAPSGRLVPLDVATMQPHWLVCPNQELFQKERERYANQPD